MWLPFRHPHRPAAVDPGLAALPIARSRCAVIDTELTGLDERRDSILSLGGVRVAGGRIAAGDTFYQEVNPSCAMSERSILVHGITPDRVRDLPPIGAVLERFVAFCGRDVLVGHFISIDLAFLRKEVARVPGLPFANAVVDTWPLYEHCRLGAAGAGSPALPRLGDPRLFEVARALGVEVHHGHNALGDAYLTAQVFQRLLRRAERMGMASLGELIQAGNPDGLAWNQVNTIPFG